MVQQPSCKQESDVEEYSGANLNPASLDVEGQMSEVVCVIEKKAGGLTQIE